MSSRASAAIADTRAPSLPRVFACCFYDAMLTVGVLFVASALAVMVNGGQALPPESIGFRIYLLAAAFPYFGYCWSHGGQTLGMRAWRVRVVRSDGSALDLKRALARFVAALFSIAAFGVGFVWIAIDRRRRSWHDIASGTRLEALQHDGD